MSLPFVDAIWSSRGFILSNVKREFQLKYRNSLLGAAWNILNPLAMIIVYTVIFSHMMRAKMPGVGGSFAYSIYLCAGSLTWGLFAEIVNKAQTVFIDNANLIKKLNFPRLCLPITVVLNALLNFFIVFGLFVVFLIISGNFPGIAFLSLIPILIVLVMFSIGLGIMLGVINVFFRDVGQFFGIFIQFWFWFTPIVYPLTALPERMRSLLIFNPIAAIISACQSILVLGQQPEWMSILPATILAIALCVYGLRLFRRNVGEMVDEL